MGLKKERIVPDEKGLSFCPGDREYQGCGGDGFEGLPDSKGVEGPPSLLRPVLMTLAPFPSRIRNGGDTSSSGTGSAGWFCENRSPSNWRSNCRLRTGCCSRNYDIASKGNERAYFIGVKSMNLEMLPQPITIGDRTAPNRIVNQPMECNDGDGTGNPTDLTFRALPEAGRGRGRHHYCRIPHLQL